MDSYLIDYLSSSEAWVLIGSGPSIERGYPSWEKLAEIPMTLISIERPGETFSELSNAFKRQDYPKVFEEAKKILGGERLIQCLNSGLKPTNTSRRIYDLIAQWPVSVYLTTNFDDEIQYSLAAINEAYIPHNNSVDHLRRLGPTTNGAIFKLHGDLRSESGLILTTGQYNAIGSSPEWEYWRTKMTSIFQLKRMVIIGYSLSDPHVNHILEIAKKGCDIGQPVCWIAPDVKMSDCKEYLEHYNIRVIPYSNQDGQHQNLLRLLETISEFVPKRITIPIRKQVKALINSNCEDNSAAPGFFVFNTLLGTANFDEKRVEVILAAIQSVLPKLQAKGEFTLKEALEFAGWPKDLGLPQDFEGQIRGYLNKSKILIPAKDKYVINPEAIKAAQAVSDGFLLLRQRFIESLSLRIRQKFPSLLKEAEIISKDVDASLTTFFKDGGLTLASALFSKEPIVSHVPSSIVKFIQEASSQYDDILMRQAFFTISVDSFVRPQNAEREYLGRIAHGFFAFHALGVFGEVAKERLQEAKKTIWLFDSSLQIHALALASSLNLVFRDCLVRLHDMGVRLFTTRGLFDEVVDHLRYANNIIRENGEGSYYVIAAARGDAPYNKSNVFLEGFIRWQSLGELKDWKSYLFQIFGEVNLFEKFIFSEGDLKIIQDALFKLGVEVINLDVWPGYNADDIGEAQQYKVQIVDRLLHQLRQLDITRNYDQLADPDKKASPESEALLIVRKERDGIYHILSDVGKQSEAWFISDTSMLNTILNGTRITWQPEAFLRFTSTLFPPSSAETSEQAFEILLIELARFGINLLDERIIENVFRGIIDQAEISITEQRFTYQKTLGGKYSEDPKAVLSRVASIYRPLAAIQISGEMAMVASEHLKQIELVAQKAIKEADKANLELSKVEKY